MFAGNSREFILNRMTEIRKQKQDFYVSNIFGFHDDIEMVKENECGVAFLIRDRGVDRIYFASNEPESLEELLRDFPAGAGIELIDRSIDARTALHLQRAGYQKLATYLRLTNSRLGQTLYDRIPARLRNVPCERYAGRAASSDTDDIYHLLYETFHPLTSHLQDREMLKAQIEDGRILLVKEKGKLTTLLTYELQGKKLYMEHMINRGDSIYMHALYFTVLQEVLHQGIDVVYTWIRKDNARALAFAGRYGLTPDGVQNYVYVKK